MCDCPYEIVPEGDIHLFQGDILPNCPFPVISAGSIDFSKILEISPEGGDGAPKESPKIPVYVDVHPVVVILSQSCDLEPRPKKGQDKVEYKIDYVLLCPAIPLNELRKVNNSDTVNAILNRKKLSYRPLPTLPEKALFGDLSLIADFTRIFVLPIEFLLHFVSELNKAKKARLRLKHGHREHLSHDLGEFFSRPARDKRQYPSV